MDNYIGKYRVVCEFDKRTHKPCIDDVYLYCTNQGQIYRYSKDTLCYYRPGKNQANKTIKCLVGSGIEVIDDYSTPDDLLFHFYEKDIDTIARIFKARTLGKDIKPTSKRNLKLFDWYKELKTRRE